jgi:hypothetical protein
MTIDDVASGEALEAVFTDLVDKSWDMHYEQVQNRRMDDLLVGAVIAATVGDGYSLIDLNSDGVKHYLRFEKLSNKERLIFELRNLTEGLVEAKTLGRRARVTVGYGEMVSNLSKTWSVLKDEIKGGLMMADTPGAITFDADLTAGYVYAQIPLLLDLDQYFGQGYQVNYKLINHHLSAVTHSLRKYLNGRINSQGG